jgi:hypothetical protein
MDQGIPALFSCPVQLLCMYSIFCCPVCDILPTYEVAERLPAWCWKWDVGCLLRPPKGHTWEMENSTAAVGQSPSLSGLRLLSSHQCGIRVMSSIDIRIMLRNNGDRT